MRNKLQEPLKDYQWATLEEMQQMLDRNTFKAVEQMLMPEDWNMKIAIDRNQTGLFQKDTNTSSRWRVPPMCGTSWACPPRRPPSPRTRSSTRTRRKRRRRKSQGCFKDQRECTGEVLFTLQQQPKLALSSDTRSTGSFIICCTLRTKSYHAHWFRYWKNFYLCLSFFNGNMEFFYLWNIK